jgi:phycobilisome rod-core linker protein
MGLPLLETAPITQNARVKSFLIGSEEEPRRSPEGATRSPQAMDELIERAYRQIFFHAFKVDREPVLESRLRRGIITTKQFIRGLLLSGKFRRDFYRCNSNYAIVEQIVGRVLGRSVHGEGERIALSILIADRGLEGFVDNLLNSEEYRNTFGEDEVPYQRSRVLAGRAGGDLPFNQKAPRYSTYWRDISAQRAPANPFSGGGVNFSGGQMSSAWVGGKPPRLAQTAWLALAAVGTLELVRIVLTTAGAMLSTGAAGG